jgi:poly-beta-1,6 N-acetyl-D-glucosamine synthase
MDLIIVFFYAMLLIYVFKLAFRVTLSLVYSLRKVEDSQVHPMISVIVPSYNEEVTIADCIQSLSSLDYPNYEVIIVDDGSTDKTLEIAKSLETPKIRVVHQENRGKANALNTGIQLSESEIIVTVDADTTIRRDGLARVAGRFARNPRLGAVAGNIKVEQGSGLLNALQSMEYTVGINLIRKAESMLRSVMIVPGPIAAMRREAIQSVGLFSDDTFAEDFDATMKLSKAGYGVEYEENALAYTDVPKSLEDLMKQRRRWYRGMIQVLDKHRDMFLRPRYGFAGVLGVPNLWFETTSPILNLALILLALLSGLYLGEASVTLIGLATYLGMDMFVGLYALSLDPVKKTRDFLTLPLLPFYNIFLDGVRLMSFTEEILNLKMAWEKPKR